MKPFEKCPVCDGDLVNKQVEKLLSGGCNTASLKVPDEVCLHCGERLYTEDIVKYFEEIRGKLRKKEFSRLKSFGQSFTVDDGWPAKTSSRQSNPTIRSVLSHA
jgi:YgiT-type zinc finger domain-containing protein